MPLKSYVDRLLPSIDSEIRRTIDQAGGCSLYDLVRYQMGWLDAAGAAVPEEQVRKHGGKKLRPVLTLLACEAAGGAWEHALPAAAAIELIHNFSLVHDDVEDGDRLRRHRLTVWGVWGVPKAVNCGSAMQALVYRAASGIRRSGASPEASLTLLKLLTDAVLEMTEGQHLDIDFQERGSIAVAQYFDMTSRKTGALLEAAARSGALLAGAPRETEDGLARFGRSFGLAFQARDDYLGVWADPDATGKAVGADIERRKKSLPVVYALEHDPEGAGRLVREVMSQETISGDDCDRVAAALDECGARQFTERAAEQHSADARNTLETYLLPSPARNALAEMAELAALRHH